MKVLGLSIITNIHDPDHPTPASMEGVIEMARSAAPQVDRIVSSVVGMM
jgi:purine-nucleoside phosphorylase